MTVPEAIPASALADRLSEIGMETNLLRVMLFGGDYHQSLVSEAFMRHEHVMITMGKLCIIAPPYTNWRETLKQLEESNA